MGYCDAVFARALSGNDVDRHAGRGAGQYRFGRRDGLKRHKQCLLGFSILGDRFEGEFGIACGGRQIVAEGETAAPAFGAHRKQFRFGKFPKRGFDCGLGLGNSLAAVRHERR